MKKQINYIGSIFFLCCQIFYAQQKVELSYKPADLATGTLKNGMHYYVMHNEEPEDRVSFYFAQNVGSILEDDSQQGLAHFLEHMAFNGTENFKDKEMLEYLEKNGIKFGSEVNAFTSFDETVYNINQVPVANEKLVDSVLLIVHDWSGSLSLTNEEIDNERGVVNEEWRSRNTAGARVGEKIRVEGLLNGTKYAKRSPIGKMDIINNFKYKELRDYYNRWYRPDEQALIIVGDIDVLEIENKVKSVFSSIPLKKNLPARDVYDDLSINTDLIYIKSTDKELGEPSLSYFIKRKTVKNTIEEDAKINLLSSISNYVFNNRLSELTQDPNCPALGISYGVQKVVRPLKVMNLSMRPKKDSLIAALHFSTLELKRFISYGATAEELNRAKAAIKTSLETAKTNSAKRTNDSYASEIYSAFFDQEPLVDYVWQLNNQLSLLDQVTNTDIIAYLSEYKQNKGQVVAVTGSDTNSYPKQDTIEAVLKDVADSVVKPFEENGETKQLINTSLIGGSIVETSKVEGIDANQYTLSNGLKLVLYPTDYDKERVFMEAFSPGGNSLLAQKDLPNVLIASYLAGNSGLGDLNNIELQKRLAGTNTSLNVGISSYSEELNGSSNLKDLETLFKRIYLSFTAPRFDPQVFDMLKQNLQNNLISKQNSVTSAFQDSLQLAASNHSPRTIIFNQQLIDEISLEGSAEVYKNRINNARDFTFVFIGDFKEKELLELAKTYLGSIPATSETEHFVNHHIQPEKGLTKVHLSHKMETPQATVNVSYSGTMEYSKKKNLELYIIGQLLTKRYMERIREEEGGSYGVNASGGVKLIPEGSYTLNVGFNCNPDKADELLKIVYAEIEKLSIEVDPVEFSEVKNNLKKNIEENQKENSYWLNIISSGLKMDIPVENKDAFLNRIDSISIKDIKQSVAELLKDPAIIEGVLMPVVEK